MDEAQWVWNSIDDATNAGFGFSEETITETLLMNLHRNFSKSILVHPFTKPVERVNGADWEWWIGRDGNWIGMRVQAKRIKLPSERFQSLFYAYDKDTNETQIGNLIEKAKEADLIPIFTFYTHSKKHIPMPSNICICNLLDIQSQGMNGCLISHAEDVLAKDSRKLSDITPIAFPWHCLVCQCKLWGDKSSPSGPADFIYSLLMASGDFLLEGDPSKEKEDRLLPNPSESLPEHIQALRSRDDIGDSNLQNYADDWDLGGLALFDLGETSG